MNIAVNYDLEEMIGYIRQNSNTTLGIHHHLNQITYLQYANSSIESSMPQAPKRNLNFGENDSMQVLKQRYALPNEKQKSTRPMNI